MQNNLNQQYQEDQEELLFKRSMADPHPLEFVKVTYYRGHPKDVNNEIRPFIVQRLDAILVRAYEKTVKKLLEEALFYFYHYVFPETINTIIEIETRYLGIRDTFEYRDLLAKYFYLAMDEKVGTAGEYLLTHQSDDYGDSKQRIYRSDGLYIDIIKSQMALYSGSMEINDPNIVKENLDIGFPLPWEFVGTDYREQIIRHVSLFWELFMVYHGVESKLGSFTIPKREQYWAGESPNVSPEAFNKWISKPLEERMDFCNVDHYRSAEYVSKSEGGQYTDN